MDTKTLTRQALSVIDQYLHFKFGSAVCSVPYFNNRTVKARGVPAVNGGKGSPQEILEEIQTIAFKNHISSETLADESLKKLLADENLGIDCSGFAWHVLNAESTARGRGALKKHVHFVHAPGLLGKIRVLLNPIKNAGVQTFADDANSRIIPTDEVMPGDMITMLGNTDNGERDHILVVHEVSPTGLASKSIKVSYSHASADAQDGVYGNGIKQGTIEIADPHKQLIDATWTENPSLVRAKKSKTELRRLNWF